MAIKKLKNGKYQVYVIDAFKQKIRLRFINKKDAEYLETKIKNEKYTKKLEQLGLRSKRYLLEEMLNEYLIIKKQLSPRSYKKYSGVVNQIKIFVENSKIKYIDEFTTDYGTQFYNFLTKEEMVLVNGKGIIRKASPKTINFYLQTLKSFFNDEVNKNHILKSPVMHLRTVKAELKKPEYYTIEELQKFFKQDMQIVYRQFFLGLLYTGMRYNEAANLKWDDVDLKKKILFVKNSLENKLKTVKSERAIPIPAPLLELLNQINESKKSEYVFSTSTGKKIRERTALQIVKKVALKADIKTRVNLHKFRATYASQLAAEKIAIESIQSLLGHSSVTTTQKSYANSDAADLSPEVSVLNNILNKKEF